jgi:hypothetical protein
MHTNEVSKESGLVRDVQKQEDAPIVASLGELSRQLPGWTNNTAVRGKSGISPEESSKCALIELYY